MEFIRGLIFQIQETMAGLDGDLLSYATMLIRFILPALAIIIIVRCARSLLQEKSEEEIWGQLTLPNGTIVDLNYWENIIGRAKSSDAFADYPTISRNHAALIRDEKGNWRIYDMKSKTGVVVNGKQMETAEHITWYTYLLWFTLSIATLFVMYFKVYRNKLKSDEGIPVKSGDNIELGGVKMKFTAADNTDEYEQAAYRTRPGKVYKQRSTLIFLTEFQLLLGLQLLISKGDVTGLMLPLCFLALIVLMWTCYFITKALKRVAFEIETIGFFLSTIGLSVVASSSPAELNRQVVFIVLGLIFFFVMGWLLRDLGRIKKIRYIAFVVGPLMLMATLVFGRRILGAIRWISIAGLTFQPSEFVKIALVLAGAVTLERMFARRNIFAFVAMMGLCMGLLAFMSDFGSALIFFVAYLVIAYMRSGDFATVLLSIAGGGFAGLVALASRPHIAGRFSTWRYAWDFADGRGYQQTRAMSAAASGGLFGVGAGEGWFHRVFAADSDLVFAMVSEELGLLVALTTIAGIMVFAVFSVRSAGSARSSFYVIAACATSAILVFQMMLNVLGSMDILPFTGVTFPFVSMGGTSLVASWGMLAFFKAADTRQNASFVVKTPKRPQFGGGGSIVYKDSSEPLWDGGEEYE